MSNVLQAGLLLYQSRGLIETVYTNKGVFFAGTEHSAAFLDALSASYVAGLRLRAPLLRDTFGSVSQLHVGKAVLFTPPEHEPKPGADTIPRRVPGSARRHSWQSDVRRHARSPRFGFDTVVTIGSDLPNLAVRPCQRSVAHFGAADALVLGSAGTT